MVKTLDDPDKYHLPAYCLNFLRDKQSRLTKNSLTCYASDITLFIKWGTLYNDDYANLSPEDMPLSWFDSLTENDIRVFLSHLSSQDNGDGLPRCTSNASMSRKLSSLRALYRYLNREGYTTNNPVEYIRNPKVTPKEQREFTNAEKAAVLKAIETGEGHGGKMQNRYTMAFSSNLRQRNKALYVLLTETPLRMPDLEALNISDIDTSSGRIKIPSRKNINAKTYITLKAPVTDALTAYINGDRKVLAKEQEKALFVSQKGDRLSLRSMEHTIKEYIRFALKQD